MATITVNDLAETLETDARTTRKFLRSVTPKDQQPGKGGRWSIEKKSVRSLTRQYREWTAAQEAAKAQRDAQDEAPEVKIAEDITPDVDEVETDEVYKEDDIASEGGIELDEAEDDDLPMPKHDD